MFVSKHHPLYQTDEVGKANPTLRNLPPQDHFYGYKPPPQPEGVKESNIKSCSLTRTKKTEKGQKKRKKFLKDKYINIRLKQVDEQYQTGYQKKDQERIN